MYPGRQTVWSSERKNGNGERTKIASLCLLIDRASPLTVSNSCETLKIPVANSTSKEKNPSDVQGLIDALQQLTILLQYDRLHLRIWCPRVVNLISN